MPPMKPNIGALSAGLAAAAVWGGMYAVSKVVLETIPPFALLSLRLTLGFLSLAAAAAFRGGLRLRRGELPAVLAAGAVGYGLSLGLQFLGTKLSAASTAAMVTSATPALVLPFAALILGERATARKVLALAVATAGVLLVVDPWRSGGMGAVADGGRPLLGNFLLVGAAAAWALYSVLVRHLSRGADLLSLSAVMLLGGLPSSLALGAVELAGGGLGPIHSSNAAGLLSGVLFLGIVSTAAAMFLWNYAFSKLSAAAASLTFFAQPVVGALLGWAFLGETITPLFLAGGAAIAAGLFISRKD